MNVCICAYTVRGTGIGLVCVREMVSYSTILFAYNTRVRTSLLACSSCVSKAGRSCPRSLVYVCMR